VSAGGARRITGRGVVGVAGAIGRTASGCASASIGARRICARAGGGFTADGFEPGAGAVITRADGVAGVSVAAGRLTAATGGARSGVGLTVLVVTSAGSGAAAGAAAKALPGGQE
jgi:hypothetical protein